MIKETLTVVFTKPKYLVLLPILSFLTLFIFVVLNNIDSFLSLYSAGGINLTFDLFFTALGNIEYSSGPFYLAGILVIAVLVGTNFTMLLFKLDTVKSQSALSKRNASSLAGVILGAFATSCASCATALISIIGLSAGLAVLPLKGFEFVILSISLLTVSNFYMARSLYNECEECRIKS
jgi:hypothetical protein